MSKHRLGPWAVTAVFPDAAKGHTFEPRVSIVGQYEGRSVRLADIPDVLSRDSEEMANARLIAAAPELLEACKAAAATHSLIDSEKGLPSLSEVERMLRAAIAKATGEA